VKRVALLHPVYWPEVKRGSERYIHDLAAGLINHEIEPELITSRASRAGRDVVDGLPVIFNRRRSDEWLRRHRFDDYWTHVPWSFRSLVRGDYDLAHAFYPTDALAAAQWGRLARRPTIFSVMGIPNPLIRIRFDSQPRAARACSIVTVDSQAVADAFLSKWKIETRVVYPGVDLHAFTPAAARSADPVIFCPAPIEVARKRVEWLLDALPAIRAEWPNATLMIMRPQEDARAVALARQHEGLEFFEQVQDAADLAPLYGSAWVTALPSRGEAFGMVLIESLACGTPVVAANRDAAPEVVSSDAVGRLFDDARPETVATSLLEALDLTSEPRTLDECRARADWFSTQRTLSAFLDIYSELAD
jgi:glycosyltransferase involved in cell wall biosynthesis